VKILVVGAGAVGSLLAARCSAARMSVELTARPEHVAAVRAHGLVVEGTGPGTYRPTALDSLAAATPPDAVFLTVKTFDLAAAAEALGRRFPRLVPMLLPQNGLGVETLAEGPLRTTSEADPRPMLVRGVNTVPVTLVGPGVVRQAGDGEILLADPADGAPSAPAAVVLGSALRSAGVTLRWVHDLPRELWRKALVNAAINPVTALHGVTNGRLLDPPYRDEALALLHEAQRAAAAEGFSFPDVEAERDFERVVRATATNRSSMLQDRDRGRPTEVDAISGAILRAAEPHGIDLPRTRAVVARLTARPSRTEAT